MIPPESIPGPAYRIHTSRTLIRCLEPEDTLLMADAVERSLDHLLPWMPWAKQEPLGLQARIDLLRKWRGNFDLGIDFGYGIFTPAEDCLLGCTGLHTRLGMEAREIGYWIHKDHLNQGLATETSAALTRVAFEIDRVQRVEIHCAPDNFRSAAIPRKLGFTHEATLHNRGLDADGNLRDSMIWTLFAEDYPSSPAAGMKIEAFDVFRRQII
ncbi:MAG: GNAT family N-acetyltransferase [Acidobacteriaceae bacterium]